MIASEPGDKVSSSRLFGLTRETALLLAFVAVAIAGICSSPAFLTAANAANFLRSTGIIGIMVLGETLVILTGEIDLSVGSTMILSVIAATKITAWIGSCAGLPVMGDGPRLQMGTVPLVVLSLVMGALFGLANGIGVTRGKVNSFIMTLGVLFIGRALGYVLTGGYSIYFTGLRAFEWIGSGTLLGIPLPGVTFVLMSVAAALVLRYSLLGYRIYMIGGNEEAARYSGIKTYRYKILTFVAAGVCASLTGLMFVSRVGAVDPGQGTGYELTAIAVSVIGGIELQGGKGNITGVFLSALFIGLLGNLLDLQGVSMWTQNALRGVLVIAVMVLSKRYMKRS